MIKQKRFGPRINAHPDRYELHHNTTQRQIILPVSVLFLTVTLNMNCQYLSFQCIKLSLLSKTLRKTYHLTGGLSVYVRQWQK
ncbi:unnamed protein product [Acanthoscelides obtectus]|uniref:Uncharacterized protein n=1 Tax=Acanthoscelides obtectus TaxID=200917 RepID=A0A9P0LLZ4_ACAOB|nr:unnamed protein product [Acanthoscelides obtectus]CAK1628332.1 hypothetical protein AOBTE_LOCUS5143 [Acanthoscelides obtectus]